MKKVTVNLVEVISNEVHFKKDDKETIDMET